jgi:uncharacterized membrane protein YphA (DoxX/SURF4 family)
VLRLDHILTSASAQRVSLLFLRVATGFLLVWGGLRKIVRAGTKDQPQITGDFGLDAAVNAFLVYAPGGIQLIIGVFCVIGLWRQLALPLQAIIHGSTALKVWWAIIDPYRWYITGVDRIVFNSHVFYPTIITFAACVLLITFRRYDTIALDNLLRNAPDAKDKA